MTRGIRALALVLVGSVLAGCAVNRPAVPVVGRAEDVGKLAGDWWGEYWSPDSGRSGGIWFRFTEGADSATGDVLMMPADSPAHDHPAGMHPDGEYVDLRDVRIVGDQVSGHLAPYSDPRCGCELRTEFHGTLEGDHIEGTFTTVHLQSRSVQEGRWRVARVSRDSGDE